jgi:integrase
VATIRKRVWESGGEAKTAWIADYHDQQGKRRLKTFKTRKEADAWLIGTRHQVASGTHTPESTSITVGEAADNWLRRAENEGLEPATIRQYRSHVEHHIRPMIGEVKLARLSAPNVQDFADRLLADDRRSRALARKVLASLKGILGEAQRRGKVAQNVARELKIGMAKRHKLEIAVPGKTEVRVLLDGAEGRTHALLAVAVFAGLRSSELRGLRWQDVDFGKRLIHVRQRADERGVIGSLKSEAAHRSVPMSRLAIAALKEWRLAAPPGAELVFCNGRGRVENHANIVQRALAPLQDRLGLPRRGLHAFRHFYASLLIDQGFGPRQVMGLLGHSSIAMTMNTYAHLFPIGEDDHARLNAAELALVG